jgi:hypothetical protein
MEFKELISFFYPLFGALSMFIIFRLLYTSYGLGKNLRRIKSLILMLLLIIVSVYAIINPQQRGSSIEPTESLYEITMKQDILCLMMAYPGHIENVEQLSGRVYIVMKSGKRILYDDKKTKSIETKIAYPDLQDMMEQVYPIEPIKNLVDTNHDPGRARVYSLLHEVYGASQKHIESNLANIKIGNRVFRFNKNNRATEAVENVMGELVPLAEKRQDIRNHVYPCNGTYNYRVIAGTNRLSSHSYGIAIDLAQDKRDYWQWVTRAEGHERLSSYPLEIVELFEENGFIWGGKWGHFDIMHFEYRPEIIIKARYFANTPGLHKVWYDGVPMEDAYIKKCIKKIDEATQKTIFPFRYPSLVRLIFCILLNVNKIY